ncbi:MAG: hypothetical protein PVI59_14980 [Anaerolineae bacterium]|jgi:uncharacterized membrane protein
MAEEMVGTMPDVTDDDKLWALLSWLFWPIAIIVLLMEEKKARPFIRYHAVQSLVLAVIGLVLGTITVGCLAIVWVIYIIVLAIKAYQGEWVTIPLVTDFCKNQGWV